MSSSIGAWYRHGRETLNVANAPQRYGERGEAGRRERTLNGNCWWTLDAKALWIPEVTRHPGGNPGADLKSISNRCCLFEVAFVWELTKENIVLPLGCLQGGGVAQLRFSQHAQPSDRSKRICQKLDRLD